QLDIYGEVLDALHCARRVGLAPDENAWRVQRALTDFVAEAWSRSDAGIWEVRGPRRHFTHSKGMAWVALDRSVRTAADFGLGGRVERWRALRDAIHAEVCAHGYDRELNAFVQYYGAKRADASLLLLPLVGFLPARDPRMIGTVDLIRRELDVGGLLARYRADPDVDGMPHGQGAFLACAFWLADNLVLQGRRREARDLFERLLTLRNDVGLLSEQYDPVKGRQLGNFPQALSHVGLVNTARNLTRSGGPAEHRPQAV